MATWKSAGKVRMTPKGIWDSSSTYEVLDLVSNTNKSIFYIAKQDVPVNIALTNEDYWVVVLDSTTAVRTKAPELVASYIQEFGPRQAFTIFVKMAINDGVSLNDAVTLFYDNAKTGKIYGVEFYCYDVSPSSVGTKTHDNANMVCVPSTNTVAGRDDYANLALFMPININYNWDDTTNLEPTITEIEGITDGFSLSEPNGLAGVLQMGAWVNMWSDGNKKYRLYSDTQINAEYVPLPQCVRAKDNSFRPWMIHAKYIAGVNSDGYLTSASGLLPAHVFSGSRSSINTSHSYQIRLWNSRGSAYSGCCLCEKSFLELMFEIKYASLGNIGIINGCIATTSSKRIALGESNTRRVLIAENDGTPFNVGATVCVGTSASPSNVASLSVVDNYRITSKSTVTIDGTTYTALEIDVPDTFSTEAGQYIWIRGWYSGSCDNIRGNDGSPYNLTDNLNPGKIQQIEFASGYKEILGDTVLYYSGGSNFDVICNRMAIHISSNKPNDGDYVLKDKMHIYDDKEVNRLIAEAGTTVESFIVPTQLNDSGFTNGYRSTHKQSLALSELTQGEYYEWINGGSLTGDIKEGILSFYFFSLLTAGWRYGARAAGSGGNRGEWGASVT